MFRIHRISAGTDFSKASETAVVRALHLAATHGATLSLVHAVDAAARDASLEAREQGKVDDRAVERARERLGQLAAALAAQSGVDVRWHCEVGAPAGVIRAHAQADGTSLIVVASRADATISGLGSTAAKVVRSPACPVLTVRAAGSGSYARIATATDLREGAERAALFALLLFPSARHFLLHALDPKLVGDFALDPPAADELRRQQQRRYDDARRRLSDMAARLSTRALHPIVADIAEDVPARAVLAYAAELPGDCVVVGHHAGAPDPELILGSLAQHVIYSSICDVLLVP